MEQALLAAGCFWGIQETFRTTNGIIDTKVGYSGGHKINPTYEEVCTGNTNHAEVVKVEYDESVITYEQILNIFFENITDPNPSSILVNDFKDLNSLEIIVLISSSNPEGPNASDNCLRIFKLFIILIFKIYK